MNISTLPNPLKLVISAGELAGRWYMAKQQEHEDVTLTRDDSPTIKFNWEPAPDMSPGHDRERLEADDTQTIKFNEESSTWTPIGLDKPASPTGTDEQKPPFEDRIP